jgi:hypothetical protein
MMVKKCGFFNETGVFQENLQFATRKPAIFLQLAVSGLFQA